LILDRASLRAGAPMRAVLPSAAMQARCAPLVLAPLCLVAAIACRPEPATTPEPAPIADPGGPTAAVDADPVEPTSPEPDGTQSPLANSRSDSPESREGERAKAGWA